MKRILYGGPESISKEENNLLAKLQEVAEIVYVNDQIDFSWELFYCRDSKLIEKKYDLVMFNTKMCGEGWLPEMRADFYNSTMNERFKKCAVPVIVHVDEEIKDKIRCLPGVDYVSLENADVPKPQKKRKKK